MLKTWRFGAYGLVLAVMNIGCSGDDEDVGTLTQNVPTVPFILEGFEYRDQDVPCDIRETCQDGPWSFIVKPGKDGLLEGVLVSLSAAYASEPPQARWRP